MKQTNRTILFEQINPEKENLLDLIITEENKISLADTELTKLHGKLEVTSFEDFVEKFSPTIHMLLDTENRTVIFSKGYIGAGEEKISMTSEHSLFRSLLELIENHERKKYVLTSFSELLENMISKEQVDSFLVERNHLISYLIKNENELTEEKKNEICQRLIPYDSGIFLLWAYVKNTQEILGFQEKKTALDKVVINNEDMQIQAVKYGNLAINGEVTAAQDYGQAVYNGIDMLDKQQILHNKQLLKDCFLLPLLYMEKNYSTIQLKYQHYCSLYRNIMQKFMSEAKPLLETIFGVKKFYDMYENQDEKAPKLVVANVCASDFCERKKKEKLKLYLETVNSKNFYRDILGYAIIPNIAGKRMKKNMIRERFKAQHINYESLRNEPEEIIPLLELLEKYQIQSFVSLENARGNTFFDFVKNEKNDIYNEFGVLKKINNRDSIMLCFPNFVIVPQEESCMCIGKQIEYDELENQLLVKNDNRIWFDLIGIEASYIAAGLAIRHFSQTKENQKITSDMLMQVFVGSKEW